MSYTLTLAGIGAVHLMAAASPGPAFVTITRISVSQSRSAALAAALGIATAAMGWAVAASLGMHLLLTSAAWLYAALKLAGGAYLAWLGMQAWRHAGAAPKAQVAGVRHGMSPWRAWRLGLATNAANPKVIVFFGSIFVALFAPDTPTWVRLAALAIVALNESAWFSLVALVFSARRVQSAYRAVSAVVDRLTGTVMVLFGLRLILSART